MATKKVTDSSFSEDVLLSPIPVVVDFWAEWCGPCRQIGPSLEQISNELAEQVTIVKMNIDENQKTPAQYGVRSIPTLLMFKQGELVSTKVGSMPKSEITAWITGSIWCA